MNIILVGDHAAALPPDIKIIRRKAGHIPETGAVDWVFRQVDATPAGCQGIVFQDVPGQLVVALSHIISQWDSTAPGYRPVGLGVIVNKPDRSSSALMREFVFEAGWDRSPAAAAVRFANPEANTEMTAEGVLSVTVSTAAFDHIEWL
jgi:hypothetical protein